MKKASAVIVMIFVLLMTLPGIWAVTITPLEGGICEMKIVVDPAELLVRRFMSAYDFLGPIAGWDSSTSRETAKWKQDFLGECPKVPVGYSAVPAKDLKGEPIPGELWGKAAVTIGGVLGTGLLAALAFFSLRARRRAAQI